MKKMNFNTAAVLLLATFSVGVAIASPKSAKKSNYVDPNPFATYKEGMKPDPKHPMAIEFDVTDRAKLDTVTAPEALAAILDDEKKIAALLAKVKPNYATCPLAACRIAAISQCVMGDEPWYAFWRTNRSTLRCRWVNALLKAIGESKDAYVQEYFLDQLRWCGCAVCGAKALVATFDAQKEVRDMAAMVARELADAPDAETEGCPCGSWALYLPFPEMKAGHVIISVDDDDAPKAKLLWRWASPFDVQKVELVDGGFKLRHCRRTDAKNPQDKSKWRVDAIDARIFGDVAVCTFCQVDGNDKRLTPVQTFAAVRNPEVGDAPDLDDAKYGKPINLLAGSIDDFELMGTGKISGWTLKNGVLSNRISRDAKGKSLHKNGNLRTKRADFFDFKLEYDVRVLPDCNSGMYLRGIYEVQVLDSFGKPVDCHNMGAYYGRVCPSVAAEKPAGEWQHVEVILWQRHITVTLNGKLIIDNAPVTGITGGAMTPDEFAKGPIYVQGDHSDADFRNLVLTPIAP